MAKNLSSILRGTNYGTLPISSGGTGVTSAVAALTALGAQAELISGDNLKSVNGTTLLGSGNLVVTGGLAATAIKTSAYTAVANDLVRCDTTAGAFSITFPAAPADGVMIGIVDIAGTFATNNLTVLPNTSKTIESDATSYILDISGASVTFVYNSSTTNWRLMETPSVPLASNTALVNSGSVTNINGILSGNGSTLTGVTLKTINGNSLTGSGNITVTGGIQYDNMTYSYTGIENISPLINLAPLAPISVNNMLSDTSTSLQYGFAPLSTEDRITAYTVNMVNAANIFPPTTIISDLTTFNAPNLKSVIGAMTVGHTTNMKFDTLNCPELVFIANLTVNFNFDSAIDTNLSTQTINLPKLKTISGTHNIYNYSASTYTFPPLLEYLGGFSLYYAFNITTLTIPFTKIGNNGIFLAYTPKLTTLNMNAVLYVTTVQLAQCRELSTFSVDNLEVCSVAFYLYILDALTSVSAPKLRSANVIYFSLLPLISTMYFPELTKCSGQIYFGSNASLTSANFPNLKTVGVLNIGISSTTTVYNFPLLEYITTTQTTDFSAASSLGVSTPLLFPSLKTIGAGFSITGSATQTIGYPELRTVMGGLTFTGFKLADLSLNKLKFVLTNLNINLAANSTSIIFNELESVCTQPQAGGSNNTVITIAGVDITTITFPTTLKRIGGPTTKGNVLITGMKLTQASVDNILVRLAALDGTNGTSIFSSRTVALGGGTNSTPSATGLTAKATLVARGCTVTHN